MEERQSVRIRDVLNAQGFAMHYRAISNAEAISKFSDMREESSVFTAKKKNGLTLCTHYSTCALK